ncbi:MAG: hypothetical protein JXA03_13215, partial [Bacteroidales bacterium]|nr:hypothetical protein [Bacteroidales bacterium]
MQKSFIILLISILVNCYAGHAQWEDGLQADTGRIDGAMFRILIPSNWNRNLVMYAHGYEMPSENENPQSFHNPHNDRGVSLFLERGFAVARSAYRKKGWALPEGVDDTEALRDYFFTKYGKPDTCYIAGHSMGGGITLAIIENFLQYYQGALPMCPLSSRPYLQVKMAFDINAVFAALFPGVLPSLKDVMAGKTRAISISNVQEAIGRDTFMAASIAQRYELKPKDLAGVIVFNDAVLRDISRLAGGNPFDNTNTLYSGFTDDWEVNFKVERLAVTPGIADVFKQYDRTGNINCPTLLMHTIYDQLIPPGMGVVFYDNLVHEKNKQSNFVVIYTNGQGHCNFTPAETGKAFDMLRQWVNSG